MDKEKLAKFPYFTGKMLKAFLNKKHPEVTLTRWKSKLNKIEKGKYTLHDNPLVYASTIITPSYLAFRTALYYYELTEQIPVKVQVLALKYKKDTEKILFYRSSYMFGYKKIQIEGFDAFISEKEKLLLDCLLYPDAGVLPNELCYLLKENLDKEKIVDYLKKINNISLIKRAGYLLELVGIDTYSNFKDKIIKNKNYPKLNLKLPKTKKINSRWRLQINEDIKI